jgi:hypothetical protein
MLDMLCIHPLAQHWPAWMHRDARYEESVQWPPKRSEGVSQRGESAARLLLLVVESLGEQIIAHTQKKNMLTLSIQLQENPCIPTAHKHPHLPMTPYEPYQLYRPNPFVSLGA